MKKPAGKDVVNAITREQLQGMSNELSDVYQGCSCPQPCRRLDGRDDEVFSPGIYCPGMMSYYWFPEGAPPGMAEKAANAVMVAERKLHSVQGEGTMGKGKGWIRRGGCWRATSRQIP
jgi:hypothetical protein